MNTATHFRFRVIIGRTHIKSVAEERKLDLQAFLRELLTLASEIAEVGYQASLWEYTVV